MQDPGAGPISQSALAHSVKEELQEPERARQCRKEIVGCQGRQLVRVIPECFIAGVEYHAPYEIGRQAAPEQHDISYVILVKKFRRRTRMSSFPEAVGLL